MVNRCFWKMGIYQTAVYELSEADHNTAFIDANKESATDVPFQEEYLNFYRLGKQNRVISHNALSHNALIMVNKCCLFNSIC